MPNDSSSFSSIFVGMNVRLSCGWSMPGLQRFSGRGYASLVLSSLLLLALAAGPAQPSPLFGNFPRGWVVRGWADVAKPPEQPTQWWVDGDGVMHGGRARGTWLMSEAAYGDFELAFEFLLGASGNSGVALRAPMRGDPAYEGLEVQLVDPAYYGNETVEPSQLTGSLYLAVAPTKQVLKRMAWNRCRIRCDGPRVSVVINDEKVIDVNLDEHEKLNARPRRGHVGFQELGREGGRVQIRNATIRELNAGE